MNPTSSPELFLKKMAGIFLGKSPGDEVGMNHNHFRTSGVIFVGHGTIMKVMRSSLNGALHVYLKNSSFKSRLSLIVQVNVVLNRTVVVDSD